MGWHSPSGNHGMLPTFLSRHSRTGKNCQEPGGGSNPRFVPAPTSKILPWATNSSEIPAQQSLDQQNSVPKTSGLPLHPTKNPLYPKQTPGLELSSWNPRRARSLLCPRPGWGGPWHAQQPPPTQIARASSTPLPPRSTPGLQFPGVSPRHRSAVVPLCPCHSSRHRPGPAAALPVPTWGLWGLLQSRATPPSTG